jgi:putative membrane protein
MDIRNTDQASSDRHTSDHLANERTFLAWIRTSIAVMGLGFVVARFGVWLRELSISMGRPTIIRHSGLSMPLGIGLMIFSGLLAVMAGWRYHAVKRAILSGKTAAAEGTAVLVSIIVVAIAAGLVAYMLASA